MRPAFSVIFLTTLIGAGQGLLVALVLGHILVGPELFFAYGAGLAVAFLGLGLLASVFHLANPQRGWRAASRWRTSWLSREVILLPLLVALAVLYGGAVLLDMAELSALLGLAMVAVALALFIATGMIYACVRFIRQWASPWTVVNYLMMGLASGFTLASAFALALGHELAGLYGAMALVLTAFALVTRSFQLWTTGRSGPAIGLKSAIGVRHTQIRQITQGFMGESFNTQEFFTPGAAEKIAGMTLFFLVTGFVIPAALLLAGLPQWAFLIQMGGLVVERWVFFASGTHVQNLYYQAKA